MKVFCFITLVALSCSAEILNSDLSLLNAAPSIDNEVLDPYWNLSWHMKAANYGDPNSQFFIGKVYELGKIVPQDLEKAITYYQKAAQQNHIEACLRLAKLIPDEAEHWLFIASSQGDSQAQINLSRYYEKKGDIDQSIIWLEKAMHTLFPNIEDLTLVSPDLKRLKGVL